MNRIIIILLVFSLTSCKAQKSEGYSFFIAGYTYGNPDDKDHPLGLCQPFKDKFESINKDKNIELGFLLGDIVWNSKKPIYWDAIINDISALRPKIHVARGNHDGSLEQFESTFGKSYKSFVHKKNLYVIIDSNLDEWNISGERYKTSILVKKVDIGSHFGLRIQGEFPNRLDAIFNLETGMVKEVSVGGNFDNLKATMIPLGSGWYECILFGNIKTNNIKIILGPTSKDKRSKSWEGAATENCEAFFIPSSLKIEEVLE